MNRVIGAAAALALFVSPALAQTPAPAAPATPATTVAPSACPAMPANPSLPDGATAKPDAMNKANQAYQEWGKGALAHLECVKTEVEALNAQILDMKKQSDARVAAYNASAAQVNALGEQWKAEAAEYEARSKKRR